MSRKPPVFRHPNPNRRYIHNNHLRPSASICGRKFFIRNLLPTYQRLLRLILLGLLVLTTILAVPALPAQTTNTHLFLQQGIQLYDAAQFSAATEIWQQAASAFARQGDSLNHALVLRYLSLAYQHLGQWQQAEQAIAQSLQLLNNQQNLTDTQAYLEVLAKALNTQGRLQWAKGEWSEALETWKKAAATYKKAGNDTGVIGSLINQAQALQALGLSSQAEAQLQQVEQILQQQSDPNLKVTGWQNLGQALRRVGNLKQSQAILQKSLQMAKESGLSQAESSILLELGNTERALANTAIAIGKQQEDRNHTQAALKFYQEAAKGGKLQAQLNLFSLLIETGQSSQATQLHPTIMQSIANLPASQTNIYARLNFARSLTCLQPGIDTKALSCINRDRLLQVSEQLPSTNSPSSPEIAQLLATAIQQARSLKDRRAESYALGQLGELYELSGQNSPAQDLTQQALLLAEEIQAPDIRYRWESQLGRLWEKQGDRKKAISAYQQAVKTLKSLKSDLLTIDADVQFSFRDNVEPIHRKLVDLLLQTDVNSQPSQTDIQQAIETIDSLQLAELENFLNCNLSQVVQLNEDVDKVDQNAAFIYPIILEDRLEVIAKLPGEPLKHYVNLVKQDEVEKTAIDLRVNLLGRNRPEDVIKNASQLYEWLIKPLEPDLEKTQQVKTLVFVLDGVLRNIPMSVLYDAKHKEYLMQKPYALALVPGLKLFNLKPLQRERLQILTAGVSEQRQVDGRKFPALPNVLQELQQISSVAPSQSLVNLKFTEANLEQQISSGTFSAVHIATHGKFSSDPTETFILAYDELLKSNDLNNLLKINNQNFSGNVELLVLSACETARGDNRATLGLAGIAVRAGARSTLSTLWQVSDRSTSELMAQFYQELTNPEITKAEALHRAMLAIFKRYKAPYYWAPYVLVGNWL